VNSKEPEAMTGLTSLAVQPFLRGGAQALWTDGNLQASRGWFDAAYRMADAENDHVARALATIGLSGLWVHEHRNVAEATLMQTRLNRALEYIDPGSPLGIRIRTRISAEADYRSGTHSAVLGMLEVARDSADPAARAEALSLAHHCLLGPDHGDARLTLTFELIAAGLETGRRSDVLMGLLWRTVDLLLRADPHAGRSLADLRLALSQDANLAVGYVVKAIEVMLHIRAGRFEEAEALAIECAEQGRVAGDVDATGWYGAHLVCIRWFQGRISELLPMIQELVDSPTLSAADNSYLAGLAVAAASTGDLREAAGAIARITADNFGRLAQSSSWLVTMHGLVEASYLCNDAAAAAAAYENLKCHAGLPVIASLGVACFGSVEYTLGVAMLTCDDRDRAVTHFRAAVRENIRLGHWPAVVWSRFRLATTLALIGDGHDAEADRELMLAQNEAAALGIDLPGMKQPTESVAVETDQQVVTIQRKGKNWEVALGGRKAQVKHGLGMTYLASLVGNPGYEIPALDLLVGPALGTHTALDRGSRSNHLILDDAAKRSYKERLAQLDREIEEFESFNDEGRAAQLRAEKEWLIAELSAAAGLAGRARSFATSDERARISVSKAIWRALDNITDADPVLGDVLRRSVQTGQRCSYRPA
jgi:hypothetical protein